MSVSAAEVEFILDTRDFFSNVSIWPQHPRDIDHRGWLANFSDANDKAIAAQLLDSYLLIGSAQAEKMMTSAFHSLAPLQADMFVTKPAAYQAAWTNFRRRIAVSFPARRNDPAGSGHLFVRAARALVPNPAKQLFEPEVLVTALATSRVPTTVVFVDDFSGTGDQFTSAWLRRCTLPDGAEHSFASLAVDGIIQEAFFIPSIATARAKARIKQSAPFVQVRPAHLLPGRYSADDVNTSLVSPELRSQLHSFLVRHAIRAGYSEKHVYGYEDCGLALSFEHSTPDNSLPIFNGGANKPPAWRPLRSI